MTTRSYEYEPPFTDFAKLANLTGLEVMQGVIKRDIPSPPITATLGFQLVDVTHGTAVFEGTTAEWLYNPLGTVHGGWTSTLLDSAMACSVHSTLEPGQLYTTLEFQVRFLKAIHANTGRVRAEAKVIHRGKRIATAEGRLVGADGTLYATATTSCIITSLS